MTPLIDKILLFPYWLTLKARHFMFDHGLKKIYKPEVPSICVGNITVGGTGKTPHTEMLLRTLSADDYWGTQNMAVLSRGYKRKTKGFQQVTLTGTARQFGDEPLQIKKKFPLTTVAVDGSRKEGCTFLTNPELLQTSKKARRCIDKNLQKADLIILDDAFQHRAVKANVSIVLVDYNRPISNDHLMPLGRLRDLPERISAADIVIVTKCPNYLDAWERGKWAEALGITSEQSLFFTTITYDTPAAVFAEGDAHYLYAQRLILFSGIANDGPLMKYLCSSYKIVRHFKFPDHHRFSRADIRKMESASNIFPTAVLMTTEKDCQRLRDSRKISDNLKKRLFYTPIKVEFLSQEEQHRFISVLNKKLR